MREFVFPQTTERAIGLKYQNEILDVKPKWSVWYYNPMKETASGLFKQVVILLSFSSKEKLAELSQV